MIFLLLNLSQFQNQILDVGYGLGRWGTLVMASSAALLVEALYMRIVSRVKPRMVVFLMGCMLATIATMLDV